MSKRALITAERLRELLHYEPTTGAFTWRTTTGGRRAGSGTGCAPNRGYLVIRADWRTYKAHRLAWLYMTGSWPRKSTIAKRDQALASLFWHSGWTQERLARQEGKKQPYISQRLVFGRFLDFIASGNNFFELPPTLTERLFRSYWDRTDMTKRDFFETLPGIIIVVCLLVTVAILTGDLFRGELDPVAVPFLIGGAADI